MDILIGLGFVTFAFFAVFGFISVWRQTARIKEEDDIDLTESTKKRLQSLAGIKETEQIDTISAVVVPTKLDKKVVDELLSESIQDLDNSLADMYVKAEKKPESKEKVKRRKKTMDVLKETEVDMVFHQISKEEINLLKNKSEEINKQTYANKRK